MGRSEKRKKQDAISPEMNPGGHLLSHNDSRRRTSCFSGYLLRDRKFFFTPAGLTERDMISDSGKKYIAAVLLSSALCLTGIVTAWADETEEDNREWSDMVRDTSRSLSPYLSKLGKYHKGEIIVEVDGTSDPDTIYIMGREGTVDYFTSAQTPHYSNYLMWTDKETSTQEEYADFIELFSDYQDEEAETYPSEDWDVPDFINPATDISTWEDDDWASRICSWQDPEGLIHLFWVHDSSLETEHTPAANSTGSGGTGSGSSGSADSGSSTADGNSSSDDDDDYLDAGSYDDPEDFYYDNEDWFEDYEEAEVYWEDYHD